MKKLEIKTKLGDTLVLAELPIDAKEIALIPLTSLNNSNPFQMWQQTHSAVQFVTADKSYSHPTVRWFVDNPMPSEIYECKHKLLGTYDTERQIIDFEINPNWFTNEEMGIEAPRRIVDFTLPHVKQQVNDYFVSMLIKHTKEKFPLAPKYLFKPDKDMYEHNETLYNEKVKEFEQVDSEIMPMRFVVLIIKSFERGQEKFKEKNNVA